MCTLLCCASAAAREYSGNRIFLFGNSPASLGRAGTGVASRGTDYFYTNPASIGDMERIGLSMVYGTIPLPTRFYDAGSTFALPTSYGVFGASFRYMKFPEGGDITNAYSMTMGNARELSRRLIIGFSLSFFSGQKKDYYYYAGGSLGFIYKFPGTGNRYGFCLKEPKLGLSAHFGYPFGDNRTFSDLNEATLGYSFTFYSIKYFNLTFFNDYTFLNYREFPVKIGLEGELFGLVLLRAGYVIPHAYNKGSFTTGLGIKFAGENVCGSVDYAMNIYPQMKMVHYLGATFEFGSADREPPVTNITHDWKFISPNNDGIKDYCVFNLSVHDWSRIKGWRLQILDSAGQVVKDYSMKEREITDRIPAKEFFTRLFLKRESLVVPGRVIWDGTNSEGQAVKDGAYEYLFKVWDERDNIAAGKTGTLFVDTTPPEVTLVKTSDLFSPNRDGKKDQFIVVQKIKTGPDDEWNAEFRDLKGTALKSYVWKGSEVPARVIWDGTDGSGDDAPEGLYSYYITSVDRAGNRASAEIREITLSREYETADITLSAEYFSFDTATALNLFPVLSRTRGIMEWKVLILNNKMKQMQVITGSGLYPKMIAFDCTDEKGTRLDDGVYYVRFSALFNSGNIPESHAKRFTVDSTPPRLKVSHSPKLFSPADDKVNHQLRITPSASDMTGIRDWSIRIYSSAGDIFKSFWGAGPVPVEILWDGLGDNHDIVESASDYAIVLEATDLAGNAGVSPQDRLEIDVLTSVTEHGLKIRISSIEFPPRGDEIRRGSKSILNRVQEVLQKYEEYDVIIEGHTDDIGKEEDNLELSERRAKAVYEYFVGRGFRGDHLSYMGMGETAPLYPNNNDENRRRNRRVEFKLVKRAPE